MTTETIAKLLPLEALHRRLGAELASLDGLATVPTSYGSVGEEHAALARGCGLVDHSFRDRLALTGEDRQRFLNGLVTCDVKSLAPGAGTYGFFTGPQGKILTDVAVLAREDALWLELPPGRGGPIAGHLAKYVISDRVEIAQFDGVLPLTLAGPRAAEVLGMALAPDAAASLPATAWEQIHATVLGVEATVVRRADMRTSAWTLWVAAEEAGPLFEGLLALPLVRPAGFTALEMLRVEAGIPRYGEDYGGDNFPQETGLETAVSYTKGCYLGQEVVARIHYRGQVNKLLRGLVFAGPAPRRGTALLAEGREAGAVGTAVDSIALGRPIGLAILHRRAADPGTLLEIAGDGQAEVRELPFVPQ
ncbi:MAG TPA: glycine cleavage T C-terminal barrel domain-containing protein [Thermoanaerobaculia bacterium]|nr:glycine cleavage T C-terminal barrel domain-containing protein [Thermoanaerobaculia bacterium]